MAEIDPYLVEKTGKSLAELQELKEIFQLVDTDHGGTISRDELETLMKTVGLSTNKNDMQLLMSEIDPTGSGEIDFECKFFIVLFFGSICIMRDKKSTNDNYFTAT